MLPLSNQDLRYDNAKFRRRSVSRVVTQALLTSGVRRNCGSCGLGKMLALLMLMGLGYLTIMQNDSVNSKINKPFKKFELQGLESKVEQGKQSTRPNPPKWSLKGGFKKQTYNSEKQTYNSETLAVNPDERSSPDDLLWKIRQNAVADAFKHAWSGYRTFAMGYDELMPLSKKGTDGLGGLGATIVDALDTAILMGLDDIVQETAHWIEKELPSRIKVKGQVNLFETTIRVLGGLLSAFHLSGGDSSVPKAPHYNGPDPKIYLQAAKELGDRLMAAFTSSPTPIPFSDVVLWESSAHPAGNDGGASSTSEVATLQLEFWYLSKVTGDPKYGRAAMKVIEHIKGLPKVEGLVPIFISPHSGQFQGSTIRLGSRGDSYYEYLLKVWLQQGGSGLDGGHIQYLREMYDEAMSGVRHLLLGKSEPKQLVYVGELLNGGASSLSPKMDHLVCFLAGNLALGASRGLLRKTPEEIFSGKDMDDMNLAKELIHTCYEMYNVTATGLAPEIAYFRTNGDNSEGMDGGKEDAEFRKDIIIKPLDRHNLLRPETVESLFVLYRVTGDLQYREWGWKIFQAFEAHTKVITGGYSSINDVTSLAAPKRDKMETFFLGETLKYLYLLFGDESVLPLDKFVFNTEAHPLPIVKEDAKRVVA